MWAELDNAITNEPNNEEGMTKQQEAQTWKEIAVGNSGGSITITPSQGGVGQWYGAPQSTKIELDYFKPVDTTDQRLNKLSERIDALEVEGAEIDTELGQLTQLVNEGFKKLHDRVSAIELYIKQLTESK